MPQLEKTRKHECGWVRKTRWHFSPRLRFTVASLQSGLLTDDASWRTLAPPLWAGRGDVQDAAWTLADKQLRDQNNLWRRAAKTLFAHRPHPRQNSALSGQVGPVGNLITSQHGLSWALDFICLLFSNYTLRGDVVSLRPSLAFLGWMSSVLWCTVCYSRTTFSTWKKSPDASSRDCKTWSNAHFWAPSQLFCSEYHIKGVLRWWHGQGLLH